MDIFLLLKEHTKLFSIFSILAYPLGFLRKDKYLDLLNVSYSSREIFSDIDYYKSGLYFLIPAIVLPCLFMIMGSQFYRIFGVRISKIKFSDNFIVFLFSTFLSIIVFSSFLYFHKLVIDEVISNIVFIRLLYMFPLPLLDSYLLIPLLIASIILPILFVLQGFKIQKKMGKLVLYDIKCLSLLCLWIGLLFYAQNTEIDIKVSMGSDLKITNSYNEISYAYLKTNKEMIHSVSIEDKYYYTKVALFNIKDNFYYASAINYYKNESKNKQYTFLIIPRDIIKEIFSVTEDQHLMSYNVRKNQEEGRVSYLLSLLKSESYKVFNNISLLSLNGEEEYFHYIVIGKKAIFNILTSHYNGNLTVNDDHNVFIDRDGNIEGITFYSVLHMERRKQILAQFGAPVVNVIVLTNDKAMITNAEKYPLNIVKYDNLNRFIENYDGETCNNIDKIVSKINLTKITK